MIRTIIMGGLGNQMFQYAAAYALAKRLASELLVDLTLLQPPKSRTNTTIRKQGLSTFPNIQKSSQFTYHSPSTILLYKLLPYPTIAKGFYQIAKQAHLFKDQWSTQYNSEVMSLRDNSCIMGYFQSECYFNDCIEDIRRMFTFVELPDMLASNIGKQIANTLSVSIHIRRGDYLTQYACCYNILDIEYYKRGISLIKKQYPEAHFYLFSDDIEWAKVNIGSLSNQITIVDHATNKDYIDMQLMSMCQHHIIANSSFSWWGAWLNPNANKMVVAPERWFATPERNRIPSDLIPDNWIRV